MQPQSIKHIRTLLGYHQSEFAQLLGVNRSSLAKAETGDRSLPTPALLKLAGFEKCVTECSPNTNADQSIAYCKKRLRNNRMALTNLERKQEQMQRCSVVGKELPIAAMGIKHLQRLEKRHETYGCDARQVTQIKIDLLLNENSLLESFIAGLSKDCP